MGFHYSKPKRYPRTKAQRELRTLFYHKTLYEFVENTERPFREQAQWNIEWLRDHIEDSLQNLQKDLDRVAPEIYEANAGPDSPNSK